MSEKNNDMMIEKDDQMRVDEIIEEKSGVVDIDCGLGLDSDKKVKVKNEDIKLISNDDSDSICILEAAGKVTLVESLDAILSSAQIKVIGLEEVGDGRTALILKGELSHIMIAREFGIRAAVRVGEVKSTILSRPSEETLLLLKEKFQKMI